jgi:hypothetical protein
MRATGLSARSNFARIPGNRDGCNSSWCCALRMRVACPITSETGNRAGAPELRATRHASAGGGANRARPCPPGRGRRVPRPAKVAARRRCRPACGKLAVNALIENRFPEFLQPIIERPLQRTFREHYLRPKPMPARIPYECAFPNRSDYANLFSVQVMLAAGASGAAPSKPRAAPPRSA